MILTSWHRRPTPSVHYEQVNYLQQLLWNPEYSSVLFVFIELLCPVCISGYRSVPLKNSYSEELELASLLVHIEIVNAKVHRPGITLLSLV